ncbi:MAG: chemotaxis protein CheW [Desulfitobacteriia bacterium]|jgi:purine-binding chemotaxis protein CheW
MGLQVVVFSLENEEYGFAIEDVREITQLSTVHPLPGAPAYIKGVINIRGNALPLIDLNKKFELSTNNEHSLAIIVEIDGDLIALAVDEVREVRTFDKIEPPPSLLTVPFISGIINYEQRMIILLSLENLLLEEELEALTELKAGLDN